MIYGKDITNKSFKATFLKKKKLRYKEKKNSSKLREMFELKSVL